MLLTRLIFDSIMKKFFDGWEDGKFLERKSQLNKIYTSVLLLGKSGGTAEFI